MTQDHKGTATTTTDASGDTPDTGATITAVDLGIQVGLIGDDLVARYADMVVTLVKVADGLRAARLAGANIPPAEDVVDGLVGTLTSVGDEAHARLTAARAEQASA